MPGDNEETPIFTVFKTPWDTELRNEMSLPTFIAKTAKATALQNFKVLWL